MKDKTWGEYAYLVVTNKKTGHLKDIRNAEITVEPAKIRTVGRLYVTLDDPHGTRFNMETSKEDKDWGAKREIYPTREEAEEVAQRMRLMNQMIGYLAFDGQKQCEKLSLPNLQLLHDILMQKQPDDVPGTEYISRKSAIEAILGEPPDAHYPGWYADIIKRIPVADAPPAARGKWFFTEYEYFTCSECGESYPNSCESTAEAKEKLANGDVYLFCPHCGKIMDGGNHDV